MDAGITSQAKIIRVQNERIDEQDDIIKDMHTLITYQGDQINSIFKALSHISKDRRESNDDDDDNDNDDDGDAASGADKNNKEDKDIGDKGAEDPAPNSENKTQSLNQDMW